MMAAHCGAKSVHTCEVVPRIAATAEQIIENNGFGKRIHVIAKQSSALEVGREIPERANVLVSEIFSSEFIGEGVFESIDDAKKRLLTPDAKIIPMGGSIMIALFAGEEIRQFFRVGQMMGFDLSHFNSTFPSKTSNFRNDLKTEFLTSEIVAFQFDFCKPDTVTPESKKIEVNVTKSGLCEGIIQWIRLQMDEVSVFENHPHTPSTSSSWQHTIFRLPTPTFLEAGQKVTIVASHNRQIVWVSLT